MAKRRKYEARRFALGMVVYALTFLVLLSVGLRIFWGYLDGVDKAQPGYAIDLYKELFIPKEWETPALGKR